MRSAASIARKCRAFGLQMRKKPQGTRAQGGHTVQARVSRLHGVDKRKARGELSDPGYCSLWQKLRSSHAIQRS